MPGIGLAARHVLPVRASDCLHRTCRIRCPCVALRVHDSGLLGPSLATHEPAEVPAVHPKPYLHRTLSWGYPQPCISFRHLNRLDFYLIFFRHPNMSWSLEAAIAAVPHIPYDELAQALHDNPGQASAAHSNASSSSAAASSSSQPMPQPYLLPMLGGMTPQSGVRPVTGRAFGGCLMEVPGPPPHQMHRKAFRQPKPPQQEANQFACQSGDPRSHTPRAAACKAFRSSEGRSRG